MIFTVCLSILFVVIPVLVFLLQLGVEGAELGEHVLHRLIVHGVVVEADRRLARQLIIKVQGVGSSAKGSPGLIQLAVAVIMPVSWSGFVVKAILDRKSVV